MSNSRNYGSQLLLEESPETRLPLPVWTCRESPYPRDSGVHQIFRDVASRFPERIAIRTETGEISYAELDRRANQLAQYLIASGVDRGQRVGLLLDRSPELIVSQLAVLKTGGTYVPIDPGAPSERVAFFVEDAGLSFLLCANELAACVPASPGLHVLCLDRDAAAISQASTADPQRSSHGSDPAYIMYTSGSTGMPKGVEIPHRGIARLVLDQNYFPAGPEQCTLLLGSPGFDGTTYEIWSALLHGACCAIFPDRWIDHQRLEHVIRSLGATCLSVSTGLFNQIIDHRPSVLATARHVMVVGEALSVPHIRRAMEILPQVRFGNGYGPTECTTFACAWTIEDPSIWGCDSVPLGPPLNNTECHIVDDDLHPAPIGVIGELLLGGDGLALRYVNRPELTAKRFIPHPFSSTPGARLYRTGDRCYWLPNGMIAYVGRNDDQVKLRGYRVELAEVEAGLRRCAGIENAAAIVHTFPSGARGLAACIVATPGHSWTEDATLTELEQYLPEAMLPNRIFQVDTLPLTPNGKVDRKALSAIVARAMASDRSAVSPSTDAALPPATAKLLQIWQQVLRDPSLDADSDFFRFGGDSLLAVELTMEIARQLGRKIRPGTLHRHSSPHLLALWLQDHVSADSGVIPVPEAVGLIGGGSGTPVFFMPGLEGYGLIPKPMVQALAGRHPYFDRLTFPAVSTDRYSGVSVEKVARGLIPQIRRVRPRGPYIFAGYSFGGMVAYEVARQFVQAGETVEHVILWDAYPLLSFERLSLSTAAAKLLRMALSPSHWSEWRTLQGKLGKLRHRLHALRGQSTNPASNPPATGTNQGPTTSLTAKPFHPLPYAGPVTLLSCQPLDENWVFADRYEVDRDGWSKVVPPDRLTVFHFPCDHMDALKPPFLEQFVAKTVEVIESSSRP